MNHRFYFVDPVDSNNHTNNIETTLTTFRDELRDVSDLRFVVHLKEFMFRKNCLSGDLFDDLIFMLR